MLRRIRPPAPWATLFSGAPVRLSIARQTADRIQRVHDVGAFEVPVSGRAAFVHRQPAEHEAIEQPAATAAAGAPAGGELGKEDVAWPHRTKNIAGTSAIMRP